MVWCHESSKFLFDRQPPVRKILDSGIPFSIGTDSSLKGSVNLFEELRAVRAFSDSYLEGRLKPRDLVDIVTRKAAAIFKVEKKHGSIAPGRMANFLVFEDKKNDPFESFMALTPKDVLLVVNRGIPVFMSEKFRNFCSADFSHFSEILVEGVPKVVWGKPIELLERVSTKLGKRLEFPFLPISET